MRGTRLRLLLKTPQGVKIPHAIRCAFQTTNKEAEYEALIAGLQLAKDMQVSNLEVFVDSLLITNHFNGSYAVKGKKLVEYLEIVKKLVSCFAEFTLTQV